MIGFVLSLTVLSVMLLLIGAAAIVFRRCFLSSKEGLMYPLWIVILLISILPLRLELPAPNNKTIEPKITEIQTVSELPDAAPPLVSDGASVAQSSSPQRSPASLRDESNEYLRFKVGFRRFVSGFNARLGQICSLLFALWISGAVIRFTLSIADYFEAKRLLELSSVDCRNRRIVAMLAELREQLGIKVQVRLRMLETESLSSPCVCGCIEPTIYLEPGCRKLSDKGLRCVLAHELCHIKRADMLFKLFSLFVTSIHWFNPIARRLLDYIHEDCELACDRLVINALGKDVSGVYMSAIIDIAERFSVKSRRLCGDSFGGGLFVSESRGVSFLKRRYANMKNFRHEKQTITAAGAFVAVCAAANILVLSSCQSFNPSLFSMSKQLSEPVEMMVRAYFGLDEDDYITPELLDKITSLEISANTTHEGRILADFTVNGEEGYAMAVPKLALKEYWNGCIEPYIIEAADSVDETSYYTDAGKLITAVFDDKIFAFYRLEDPYSSELTERAVEEVKLTYPALLEKGAMYVFDPYSSEREIQAIYDCFDSAGLLEPWAIDSDMFDASSLAYFKNLKEISFNGFTPVNYSIPDGVNVLVDGAVFDGEADLSDRLSKPIEMMVRAHFGLSERAYITPTMLGEITTLEITANNILEGKIIADFTVNGSSSYANALPKLAEPHYWENFVSDKIEELREVSISLKTPAAKIKAFYRLTDVFSDELSEDDIDTLRQFVPELFEKGALYVMDPYTSEREYLTLYSSLDALGLLDSWTVDSTEFDASSLANLPNLTEVTFNGFTPVNLELPDSVKVIVK